MKPADFVRHGFTQGCPGCVYAQTSIGSKRIHSEICRQRLEAEIMKDRSDTRTAKTQERIGHYLAKKVAENERDEDQRQDLVQEPIKEEDKVELNEAVPDVVDNMECIDSVAIREDQEILYRAILGHDFTEVYSSARMKLAADRHMVSQ